MPTHFVANFIFNKKIEGHFFKFRSHQDLQAFEVNPLFDHFQNANMRLSEPIGLCRLKGSNQGFEGQPSFD